MNFRLNEFEQPIGLALPEWAGAKFPTSDKLVGIYCNLEHLSAERHAMALWDAYRKAPDIRDWTYLFAGPFSTFEDLRAYLLLAEKSPDYVHYAVMDQKTGKAVGTLALMRIDTSNGVIEVGSVAFSRLMQRTCVATEAVVLLVRYVFEELGYRRVEWKCDTLNEPSRAAASRFGFVFEGIFRQAIVTHQRNRDTAWYSIIDSEYPILRAAYMQWLDKQNFDVAGKQIERLADLIAIEKNKMNGVR